MNKRDLKTRNCLYLHFTPSVPQTPEPSLREGSLPAGNHGDHEETPTPETGGVMVNMVNQPGVTEGLNGVGDKIAVEEEKEKISDEGS